MRMLRSMLLVVSVLACGAMGAERGGAASKGGDSAPTRARAVSAINDPGITPAKSDRAQGASAVPAAPARPQSPKAPARSVIGGDWFDEDGATLSFGWLGGPR